MKSTARIKRVDEISTALFASCWVVMWEGKIVLTVNTAVTKSVHHTLHLNVCLPGRIVRHYARAGGGGYDKLSVCMTGSEKLFRKYVPDLPDFCGANVFNELEGVGFEILQVL